MRRAFPAGVFTSAPFAFSTTAAAAARVSPFHHGRWVVHVPPAVVVVVKRTS
jgi:hypothetical protein